MSLGDSTRRQRRLLLFLISVLVPTALLVAFAFRLVRQDEELAESRLADERRRTVAGVARDLSSSLESLKLAEANRWDAVQEGAVPERLADSPIVFAAPIVQNRVVLPWEYLRSRVSFEAPFARALRRGESQEFVEGDPQSALGTFRDALDLASSPPAACSARLGIGRNLIKAGRDDEAADLFGSMLELCDGATDGDGVPFSLYAADRLIRADLDPHAAAAYVLESAARVRWKSPAESYLLRSLLERVPGDDARRRSSELAARIAGLEQMVELATQFPQLGPMDFPFRQGIGHSIWQVWGDAPWFITLISPSGFGSPIVLAVAADRLLPAGAGTLSSDPGRGLPLGEAFVDAFLTLPDDRFASARPWSIWLYGLGVALLLGITAFAGRLLLRDVNREIQTAQMRSQFVASVSHELKTPLTAIRMFAETLAARRFRSESQQTEYLETIVNESERLSRLVDNVLDFSRIERGKKTLQIGDGSLVEVVESATRTMRYPLAQHGFELVSAIDRDLPRLRIDADALEQAVLNLLTNAVKYSGGSRRIELRLYSRGNEAVIEVVDHGVGMSPEDQKRIFEKFYRANSEEVDGIAGAGLGLTIAAHLVRAHGGRIEVSSAPGQGSTFSVHLPLESGDAT